MPATRTVRVGTPDGVDLFRAHCDACLWESQVYNTRVEALDRARVHGSCEDSQRSAWHSGFAAGVEHAAIVKGLEDAERGA